MRIRFARPEDASEINAIYRLFVSYSAVSFELGPPSDSCMAERIAVTLQRFPWLVNYSGERTSGYAYASQYRNCPAR